MMPDKSNAVFGIYKDRLAAEAAVDVLHAAGFSESDISVLLPDEAGSQAFAHVDGTKPPEGAATGASTGAVVGGAVGLLVGVGALALPGIGPLIAAGPIVSALAGAGVMGALGGAGGALIGLGIPEYVAKKFESKLKEGRALLSVHIEAVETRDRATAILEKTGATDIAPNGVVNIETHADHDTLSAAGAICS